jgi:hypothetical protein
MSREQFAHGMLLLATSLQQELDDAQLGVYWHHLKALPVDVRSEVMRKASGMKWFKFPQPGQLKELAAGILEERRKAAAAVHLADCTHSGRWIEGEDGTLQRCPCHARAMQAMADAGQPLALPSYTEPAEAD